MYTKRLILPTLALLAVTLACGGGGAAKEATPPPAAESTRAQAAAPASEPTSVQETEPPAAEPTSALDIEAVFTQPAAAPDGSTTALTAGEFYDLALAAALQWQPDAVLIRISGGGESFPLDDAGRGEVWTAEFYSPAVKETNDILAAGGNISTDVESHSGAAPRPVPDMQTVNLDLGSLYDTVLAAAGTEFDENTEIAAVLRRDVLDESVPVWTIRIVKVGAPEPPFTAILDARSGEILRSE